MREIPLFAVQPPESPYYKDTERRYSYELDDWFWLWIDSLVANPNVKGEMASQ